MSRSVDRALALLRDRLAARGVLDVAEKIAAHHGCTLLDVASWASVADVARKDTAKALAHRGVSMATLAEWLGADIDEVMDLMSGDVHQRARIRAALGELA